MGRNEHRELRRIVTVNGDVVLVINVSGHDPFHDCGLHCAPLILRGLI